MLFCCFSVSSVSPSDFSNFNISIFDNEFGRDVPYVYVSDVQRSSLHAVARVQGLRAATALAIGNARGPNRVSNG